MRVRSVGLAAVVLITNLAAAQSFGPFGLQGNTITAMTYYGGSLYAATENDGVYRRFLGAPDSGWVGLGLPTKNLTSIFAFHTVCPLKCWKGVLAGAALSSAPNDTTLIYFYQQYPDTYQQKGRWVPAASGIARANVRRLNALGGIDVCHPIAPTYVTVFAATPGVIWRSEDRGKSWEKIWQMTGANILTFATKPRTLLISDDEIWAGGTFVDGAGRVQPLMLRSTNSGAHWEDRSGRAFAGGDECRAATQHYQNH